MTIEDRRLKLMEHFGMKVEMDLDGFNIIFLVRIMV